MNGIEDSARLRLLYDLGCSFAERTELRELIPYVIERCREVLLAQGISVLLLDPIAHELYFPYVAQDDPEIARRLQEMRMSAELGFVGIALSTVRSIRVDDAQADPRHFSGVDKSTGMVTRAVMAVPLVSKHGGIGVVEVVNKVGGGPFSDDDLALLELLAGAIAVAVENAQNHGRLRESQDRLRKQVAALQRDPAHSFPEIIGTSPAMNQVFRLMETAAASDITVLIEGETGTGKELVARGVFSTSGRSDRPFLVVNCAALPETLLESELFGHRRGAFTGAVRDQIGMLRAADGGVIFLDEIGDMPLAMQAKLLRFLEAGEVVPLGEAFPHKVDVRVLCATNRDLRLEVARRNFREDLYYRISAFPIHTPPLRERREDIPLLASRFVAAAAERVGKNIPGIEPRALELLQRHDWLGNVRELLNEMERAVAIARDGEYVGVATLSAAVAAHADVEAPSQQTVAETPSSAASQLVAQSDGKLSPLREARALFEASYIRAALNRMSGNVSQAARMLGVSRVSLQKKMKAFGLR
ncbi:MAG TPA: sigma 54-interacting transcriptional regulator [Candidatus Binataceae bacterium]|nr:sigma 54-interacting transcriptional regulator [Candidatus Binataceae bacterium]